LKKWVTPEQAELQVIYLRESLLISTLWRFEKVADCSDAGRAYKKFLIGDRTTGAQHCFDELALGKQLLEYPHCLLL
jgi:hypothetical protein